MKRRLVLFVAFVLGLAYLVPNHSPPWVVFHEDALAGIAFAPLLVWGLWSRKAKPTLMLLALLLALVPAIQLWGGQILFASDAWLATLYLLGFAFAVLAGARIVSDARSEDVSSLKEVSPLFACFVFAGLISVGIAVHQWLDLGISNLYIVDLRFGERPYGNLAQPNQLATLLLLGQLGLIFMYEAGTVRGRIALAGAMMLAFGLAMTQSRSVLIALVLFWIAFFGLRKRASLRISLIPLLAVMVFYACISWSWPLINDGLLLSQGTSLAGRFHQDLRLTVWWQLLDAVTRAPWLGYGWGQVPIAQQVTALDHPATHHYFTSAHNIVIDLAIWCGIPLATVVVIFALAWFAVQARYCRDPLSWCALVAVLLLFGHSLVEFPLYYAYFLLPIGLLMGALQANLLKLSFWNVRSSILINWLSGLFALSLFVAVVAEYPGWEQEWQRLRFEKARIGKPEVGGTPRTFLLTEFPEIAWFARLEPTPGMSSNELKRMEPVVQRFGWSNNLFKYAIAMGLNGAPEKAEEALARLCRMHTERNCKEARETWVMLAQEKYPELRKIKLPDLQK